MGDQSRQRAAHAFLRERARSGATFTKDDVNAAMGWVGQTGRTYISKHFRAYTEAVSPGVFRVLPEFKRVSWDEFQDLVTQVRHPFASYDRATYHCVVVYDFLMPLTREDKLRRALDELFYRDTLERRIEEVGLEVIRRAIPIHLGENDKEYVRRVIQFIDDRIGGFSISHVSGRFRVCGVLSRAASAEKLAKDQPYLIDETTAVVRFIIPCLSSRKVHGSDFQLTAPKNEICLEVAQEIQQIRAIFFELFVEALVPTIRGEKLIWMLETTPDGQKLYELNLMASTTKAGAEDSDEEEPDADSINGTAAAKKV